MTGKGGHAKACEIFNRENPLTNINTTYVANLLRNFVKTGSVLSYAEKKAEFTKETVFEQEEFDAVHHVVNEDPHTSATRCSLMTGISRKKVVSILKRDGFKPYKLRYMQELKDIDFPQRLSMCLWFKQQLFYDPDILRKCCFSDEPTFTVNGVINSQNMRLWSDENLHW